MSLAYYNEIDPYAAQWLRNLIAAGHIAPGDVDERSIVDVQHDDLKGYAQCHFFAGIGGWSYALRLAGWPDDRPVWTGSCPCQPFSAAGAQRGSDDARHLWPAFFRLIRECRPAIVFGEQVASSSGLAWWDHVAADLEGDSYAAAAVDIGAHSVGAPHIRQRLYWVADADAEQHDRGLPYGAGRNQSADSGNVGHADHEGLEGRGYQSGERAGQLAAGATSPWLLANANGAEPGKREFRLHAHHRGGDGVARLAELAEGWREIEWLSCADGKARPTQPGIFPLVAGLPEGLVRGGDRSMAPDADQSAEGRVMRLRGYGNSIVPQVAAAFVRAAMT
jgi:DNA (cytosine-5)-methyltransferase 1